MISSKQIMGVDSTHICAVNDTHFLLPRVRDAFLNMQQAAQDLDLDLQICSSFRGFDKQLSIWNRKWMGTLPLYTLNGEALDANTLSDEEKIHAIMLWSALPGASRHHWGTDFDFFDQANVIKQGHTFELVTQEYENNGPCAKLTQWVHKYAEHFGFYLPYAQYKGGVAREPWHLSHQETAENIQAHFDIAALHEQLTQSGILGKQAVLAALPELVTRYTYNKGIQK
ncbi:M15 family metallopeptidase [Glaciecola sp. SC05]|uniref:M15 family metallopeptidase n=1 Tax=Glaciecola sp. SC05 TaxID=1987355 RepID=UPI003526DB0A